MGCWRRACTLACAVWRLLSDDQPGGASGERFHGRRSCSNGISHLICVRGTFHPCPLVLGLEPICIHSSHFGGTELGALHMRSCLRDVQDARPWNVTRESAPGAMHTSAWAWGQKAMCHVTPKNLQTIQ